MARSGNLSSPESIGKLLRAAREARGQSIEEAARALHMPPGQIEGLEEGTYSVFSAEIYARGAYQQYARLLGVDTEKTKRAMLRSLSHARQDVPLEIHTPLTFLERLIHPRMFILAAGILVVLAVGGYVVWQVRSFWQLPVLTITSPQTPIIESDQVTIAGHSESQARIVVNEQTVLLNEEDQFSVELFLRPGVNIVRVEAENVAGRTRVREMHLLRPRDRSKVKG